MYHIKNYLNGVFKDGSGQKIEIISPKNGSVIGFFKDSLPLDLTQELTAIKSAQQKWATITLRKKSQILYKYRDLVLKEFKTLAEINSLENGKLISEAMGGINKALEVIEFACAMPNLVKTRNEEVSSGKIMTTEERRPIGIVSSITPFNFPIMVPHWTVPITIMAGNAIILKPSEFTPISAYKMAELFEKAGLPPGIFNVINGGKAIVETITENELINGVTFVGSSKVAEIVYHQSALKNKKVLALGEAKNHILVAPDANSAIVARDLIGSAFGMAGQRCMAASVLVTIKDFHVKDQLVKLTKSVELGKDMGPVINPLNYQKLVDYIEYAQKEGAEILVDGRSFIHPNKTGYWIGPTIIDWKNNGHKMSEREVFGPLLEVVHVNSLGEAVAFQNQSSYGNAASIYTQNGKIASDAIAGLEAGMLGINVGVPVPRDPFSFGGIKGSKFGTGDITGNLFWDFVTETIKITTKWNVENFEDWMS